MISIPYGESSFRFKHRYHDPVEQNAFLQGMSITITRTDSGAELVAAAAMTPSTGTGNLFTIADAILAAGSEQLEYTVSTGSDTGAFEEGDTLAIWSATNASPAETIDVMYYTAISDTLNFKRPLLYSHNFGDILATQTYYYDLDVSTVADWPAGMEVQIVCAPTVGVTNQGLIASYVGRVEKTQFILSNVSSKFAAIYPHVYGTIENRFEEIEQAAYQRLNIYFQSKGRNINTVADQDMLEPALIEQIYLLGVTRTDTEEFEIRLAMETLNEHLLRLEQTPIWFDDNQDKVKDETEIGVEAWYPVGRGI